MRVVRVGGSIGASDREFNRTPSVEDLLEGSFPLVRS